MNKRSIQKWPVFSEPNAKTVLMVNLWWTCSELQKWQHKITQLTHPQALCEMNLFHNHLLQQHIHKTLDRSVQRFASWSGIINSNQLTQKSSAWETEQYGMKPDEGRLILKERLDTQSDSWSLRPDTPDQDLTKTKQANQPDPDGLMERQRICLQTKPREALWHFWCPCC